MGQMSPDDFATVPISPPAAGERVDEPIGAVLGTRYRVESLLGRGGMSSVYLATDTLLGRAVALKVFSSDLADASDLDRQSGEIRLLASLNHPALVTAFDAVTDDDGRLALVLEFVDGVDLRTALKPGALDRALVARIGADVADALAYVHDRSIVHRDLKPGNVLLPHRAPGDTGPRAKLADFGIARLLDATRLTTNGSTLGTAGYLSPEQALGAEVGTASDVYSLGLVLLECLTGVTEFPGTVVESALARVSRDPVLPEYLGDEWTAVIASMTARDPRDRASAADAGARMRALAHAAAPAGDSASAVGDPAGEAATVAFAPRDSPTKAYPSSTESLPAAADAATIAYGSASAGSTGAVTVAYDSTTAGSMDAATVAYRSTTPAASATGSSPRASSSDVFRPAPAAVPDGTSASAPSGGSVPGTNPADDSRRRLSRRTAVVAVIVGAILLAVVLAVALPPLLAGSPTDPAPTYPVVEGELGEHLDQLQRSVEQ